MTLRNAFRLLGTNFSWVWKNLAYTLVILAVFGAIMVAFGLDIMRVLIDAGFFASFADFWGNMVLLNTVEFSREVMNLAGDFVDIIVANASALVLNFVGVGVAFVLFCIFINMASLPMSDVIKGHMSSLSKFGFCGAYLRNFWNALKQGILLFVVKLPYWAIIGVCGYYVLNLMALNSLWAVLSPMLFVVIALVVLSIENTVLACFTPYLALHSTGVCRALDKGAKTVSKRFYRTLSNNIVIVLLAFVINFVCARYTFGVSLLITLPATIVFNAIFNMVVYYESQGMRYYIDSTTIINSKEFAEQDCPADAKFVI